MARLSSTTGTVTVQQSGQPLYIYQAGTGVAIGSVFTFTYTATSVTSDLLITVSSDSVSAIRVTVNGVEQAVARLTWTSFNVELSLAGIVLQPSDNIKVLCTNNSKQSVAEFNVSLNGETE